MNLTITIPEIYDLIYKKNYNNSYKKVRKKLSELCKQYLEKLNFNQKISKNQLFDILETAFSIFMACGYTSENINNERIENTYFIVPSKNKGDSLLSQKFDIANMNTILCDVLLNDKKILSESKLKYLDLYINNALILANKVYENNLIFFIDDFANYIENKLGDNK